jgi:hypothetical protein
MDSTSVHFEETIPEKIDDMQCDFDVTSQVFVPAYKMIPCEEDHKITKDELSLLSGSNNKSQLSIEALSPQRH